MNTITKLPADVQAADPVIPGEQRGAARPFTNRREPPVPPHWADTDREFYTQLDAGLIDAQGVTTYVGAVPKVLRPSTAPELLRRAVEVMEERAREYDKPQGERSVPAVVTAFNAITGHKIKESEGWLFMELLKMVRLFSAQTYHADSGLDNIAYAALIAECRARE